MQLKRLLSISILLLTFGFTTAWAAADSFLVKNIKFEGLQHISEGTALNYLPVKSGEVLHATSNETTMVIQTLYKTGFFTNIALARQGHTLIVIVHERPVITKIKIKGNKAIPTKQLKKALTSLGVREGGVYDSSKLSEAESSLQNEYYNLGKYNAVVKMTPHPESKNRMLIDINIKEGQVATIKQIHIIGNKAFPEKTLIKQFKETTPSIWAWITKSDQYSKVKLNADLERLKAYYLDNGYIKYHVISTQVTITPDRKSVYIIVKVSEGPQYHVKGYKLEGKLIVSRQDLEKKILLKPGDVFSRKKLMESKKAITDTIADYGYAFSKVDIEPKVDDKNRTVFVTFIVKPGYKVYVGRITFTGNTKTSDEVLRRAMRQPEQGLFSLKSVKESERQLKLLPFVKNASMKTPVVPNKNNKIDLDYKVKEDPSAQIGFGIGYSDTDGLILNANFNQSNFLGTGKALGINLEDSGYERLYRISYTDPYVTLGGISRTISLYSSKFEPGKVNITSYTTDEYGAAVNYSIPVTENNFVNLGGGYENTSIDIGTSPSTQLQQFVATEGSSFQEFKINSGWTYNGLDQYIFPTKGIYQSLSGSLALPADADSLTYYKVDTLTHIFVPLSKSHKFVLSVRGEVGFGAGIGDDSSLPFFENYFAGGTGSVRGYEGNSLGPLDSTGDPLGGNMLVDGSISLIFPTPFIQSENLRTSVFLDGGNVYNTKYGGDSYNGQLPQFGPTLSNLNYSVGLGVTWRIPMLGPMQFSFAKSINKQQGADSQIFNFNIGTMF